MERGWTIVDFVVQGAHRGCLEGVCPALRGATTLPYAMAAGLVPAGFCNASMALVGATHRSPAIPKSYRVRMHASGSVSTQVALEHEHIEDWSARQSPHVFV